MLWACYGHIGLQGGLCWVQGSWYKLLRGLDSGVVQGDSTLLLSCSFCPFGFWRSLDCCNALIVTLCLVKTNYGKSTLAHLRFPWVSLVSRISQGYPISQNVLVITLFSYRRNISGRFTTFAFLLLFIFWLFRIFFLLFWIFPFPNFLAFLLWGLWLPTKRVDSDSFIQDWFSAGTQLLKKEFA